jgi:hypothetical protein
MKLKSHSPSPNGAVPCPTCAAVIHFWSPTDGGGIYPHFYCDACSNVYWSQADWLRVQANQDRTAALAEIDGQLPLCPCGGQFRPGSNPQCGSCSARVPHQDEPAERLFDPNVIVVQGARLFTPADE